MSESAGAGSPIAAEVIPQLAAVAAQIAATHEALPPRPSPRCQPPRVKAPNLPFRGSTVPASYDAPSYAVVMTGHFASYRGGSRRRQVKLPVRGRCLVVVIDAATLLPTDATMNDEDDTSLLAQLGPVVTRSQ